MELWPPVPSTVFPEKVELITVTVPPRFWRPAPFGSGLVAKPSANVRRSRVGCAPEPTRNTGT
jgi:hypothetical protein